MRKGDEDEHARARAFWSGTITFGLVSLPVTLYPANRPAAVSLRMVDRNGTPLSRRSFCPRENRQVDQDEIVRGYEIEPDRYVVVTDEELNALEPKKSREIDLRRFVKVSQIDPTYFERAYFLVPATDSTKAYRLLVETMERAGRAGIATFVMRGKEYVTAIIAEGGILRAETLRFHDELRSAADVALPEAEQPDAEHLLAFERAIDTLSAEAFDPTELTDRYGQRVLELVKHKLEGGEDVVEPEEVPVEPEHGAEAIDLMEILKQSLRQRGAGRTRGHGKKRAARAAQRTEARKPSRTKRTSGRKSWTSRDAAR